MTDGRALTDDLETLDSLSVAVLTDDISDNYVSKTAFATSEFSNVVLGRSQRTLRRSAAVRKSRFWACGSSRLSAAIDT
jgi:hypothetical protein